MQTTNVSTDQHSNLIFIIGRFVIDWAQLLWHIVAVMEFLLQSVFYYFQISAASGQGKHAALTGTVCFFIGYPENAKKST